jgi:hypothetical protein
VLNPKAKISNEENLWVETKSAKTGWSSAVGLLAVYRLEPSEKEIHLNNERSELSKLAPTSVIAFHDQPAEALFVGTHKFSCR